MDFREEQEIKISSILVKINKLMDLYIGLEEKYLKLQQKNADFEATIKRKNVEIKELNNKIKDIKIGDNLNVAELDNSALKARINEFVKEIDKCMAVLNK